jgi:hypothetical protein
MCVEIWKSFVFPHANLVVLVYQQVGCSFPTVKGGFLLQNVSLWMIVSKGVVGKFAGVNSEKLVDGC